MQILNVGSIITVTDDSLIEVDIESNLKFLEPYGMSGRVDVDCYRYVFDESTKKHIKQPYISKQLTANKLWTTYDKKFVPAQIMLYPGLKFEVTRLRNSGGIVKKLTSIGMRVIEVGEKNPKKIKKSVLTITVENAREMIAEISESNE